MFGNYRKDKRTDRERYLEDELERWREQSRREYERQEKAREERRKEQQEQWAHEERQANSWPEAFQKQANLCWWEHRRYPEQAADDDYFEKTAQANEKALEIWKEVAESKQAELDALEKQIEAVWDSVRDEVADKLIAASDHYTYRSIAKTVRDDSLGGYLDW
jgi:hypothetical protein